MDRWVTQSGGHAKFRMLYKCCHEPSDSIRLNDFPDWLKNASYRRRIAFFAMVSSFTYRPDGSKSLEITLDHLKNPDLIPVFGYDPTVATLADVKQLVEWETRLHVDFDQVHKVPVFFNKNLKKK